jgi:hypothetical protein
LVNSEVVPVIISGKKRIKSVLCHLNRGCIEAILFIAGDAGTKAGPPIVAGILAIPI